MGLEKALRDLKKAVTGGSISSSGALGPDGFPSDPASQHFTWHGRINDFLAEVPDFTAEYTIKPAAYPSDRCILDAPAAEQILAVEAMMLRRAWIHKEHSHSFSTSFGLLHKLTNQLFRRELPYTCDDAARLVKIVAAQMASTHWFDDDLIPILKICERLKAQAALSAELRQALQQLKAAMRPNSRWESAARERFRDTIDRLMALRPAEPLDAAFGNLSASAQTRREVLERLVPRLKIAGVCSLQEKFLVVRGSLRTYKIHLGSANILMEPNDRYLCIVPDRSHVGPLSNQNVFLPFEGDNTLAIILSKAFLLADDAKIKDLSILNQIRH